MQASYTYIILENLNGDYILENYVYALKDARKGDHMSHAGISIWHCKGLWAIK